MWNRAATRVVVPEPAPYSTPAADPNPSGAAEGLLIRWLELSELERRAFIAMARELTASSAIVERSAIDLSQRFQTLAESAKALIVDASKVTFIASLGVRTLMVSAKTLMRRGAYMAVCGPSEGVEAVLRSTGFDELVGLHPDVEDAIKSYKRREAAFANRKA